jgi:hypothetical protein
MKKSISFITLILILCSCSSEEEKLVSGTLNPNIRSFINFQTASDTEINNFIKRIDSLAIKLNDSELKSSSKFYHNLLRHKLIKTPSIYLKQKNNSDIHIFINKNQFQKIERYNYLGSDIKYKINIKLRYKEIEENIFLCDSILEVDINKL